jgi:hypothetical protein
MARTTTTRGSMTTPMQALPDGASPARGTCNPSRSRCARLGPGKSHHLDICSGDCHAAASGITSSASRRRRRRGLKRLSSPEVETASGPEGGLFGVVAPRGHRALPELEEPPAGHRGSRR